MSNFREIRSVGAALICGRTDGRDEANRGFVRLREGAKKIYLYVMTGSE
jgi:hypothetical protein